MNEDDKTKYVNDKQSKLTIHNKVKKIVFNENGMTFDAISLYHSPMWDKSSVYTRIEHGFAFNPYMNDFHVEAFNNQTLNQNGNESEILEVKHYNPQSLIFQHLASR